MWREENETRKSGLGTITECLLQAKQVVKVAYNLNFTDNILLLK